MTDIDIAKAYATIEGMLMEKIPFDEREYFRAAAILSDIKDD